MRKPNPFAPLFRKGGPVKLSGGGAKKIAGAIAKGARKVLSPEESERNLKSFLDQSKIKDRLYHATPKDFTEFKPGGENPTISGPAIWLTPNKEKQPAAHNIGGGKGGFKKGTNVMPVYVQAKSPLMLDDPDMIEWARDVFARGDRDFPDLLSPEIVQELRKDGYDSIIHADPYGSRGGEHEIIMFDPNKIKSAIGNQGTYDITNPDITKAKGGLIRMQAGGDPRGEMKASPQNPVLGALARGLRSAQNVVGQYQVDPRIPLVGGMGVDELLGIPGAAGLVEDVSYYGPKAAIKGGNVATGGIGTYRPDPRIVDVAGVAELGGLGVQAAKGAGKIVGQQLQRQMAMSPLESQLGMARVGQVQAPVSKLGFYNPVEQAALNIQRKQGPGQAFLNEIQRAENVNKEFLRSSGIAERLASMPKVTREEVQAMVKGSVPEVEQVVLAENVIPTYAKQFTDIHHPDFDPENAAHRAEAIRLAESMYDMSMRRDNLDDAEFAAAALDDLQTLNERYKPGSYEAQALAKYADYTIPGGENYREILLRLPAETAEEFAKKMYQKYNGPWIMKASEEELEKYGSLRDQGPKVFKSTHWQEPNVISHIRVNDRTDAEGKKVLFIEELQSDWGQEGRKRGFAKGENKQALAAQYDKLNAERNKLESKLSTADDADPATQGILDSLKTVNEEMQALADRMTAERSAIPSAPFVQDTKDWVDLSLKNILKRAIDEGYDRVAFINGKQSADRYKLTDYVSKLEFVRTSGGVAPGPDDLGQGLLIGYDKSGRRVVEQSINDPEKQLPDYIGKEAAQRMLEQEPRQGRFGGMGASIRSLQGQNLEFGGTGMKKFYDQIVPERVRKVLGKEGTLREVQFEDPAAKLREELANATPGSSRYLYLTDKIGQIERDAERYGAVGNQIGFDITPELREKFSAPIPYKDGGVVKLAGGGRKKLVERAAVAVKEFVDPKTTKIEDWQWKPLAEVDKQLKLSEVPDYIQRGYGDFMIEQAKRAGEGGMGVRDLIKAFGITQSSIGRGGLSHATATKAGLKVPKTEGLVRPEGAFAEWLGSKMGQKFLDDAERGVVNEKALDDIRTKFAPFGKPNQLTEQLAYAVNNLPNVMPQMQQALTGPVNQYRDWAESMKGIAGAKSGFIGSLLGRGDLPTLDARQLNLHALEAPVGTGSIMARGKGLGAREAVDRLAARQSALGLDIDPTLDPYYQHLAHHAVWDKVANEKTTHDDLMRALRGYKAGGQPDIDAMRLEMQRKSWRSK